jgi:hypothetical protein
MVFYIFVITFMINICTNFHTFISNNLSAVSSKPEIKFREMTHEYYDGPILRN